MRVTLSLTIATALAGLIAAPAVLRADEVVEHHSSSSYQSEKTTVESVPAPAPVVRERTTVETVPAAPVVQKRTEETVVKENKAKDHDD